MNSIHCGAHTTRQ